MNTRHIVFRALLDGKPNSLKPVLRWWTLGPINLNDFIKKYERGFVADRNLRVVFKHSKPERIVVDGYKGARRAIIRFHLKNGELTHHQLVYQK